MPRKPKTFQAGDRVAYSAGWLKSTMAHGRGRWRGTVQAVESFGPDHQLVTIQWDHGPVPSEYHDDGFGRVLAPNLTLVSRVGIDAALAG